MSSAGDKTPDTLGLADTHIDQRPSSSTGSSITETDVGSLQDSWMTSMAGLLRAVAAAPAMDGAPALAPGSLVDDSFRVESLIAAGGMGVVYLAQDVRLGRNVALKIHLRSSNPDNKSRLMREASAMARLTHPNVLTVHEVGWIDEHLFVAMEYVDGWTLRSWLDAEKRSVREILHVLTAAGDGLAAAHAAGFVHRDFKPDNVLIGRDGRVLVADFGLVRTENEEEPSTRPAQRSANPLDHSLTITGARMGTPAYMSPEQMRGDPVDARADQFSYCVALYESLYRSRPYAGRSAAQLRVSLEEGRPREPTEDAGVPPHARRAIMRGLAAQPTARHASMDTLLERLRDDPAARRRTRIFLGAGALSVAAVAAVVVLLAVGRGGANKDQLCRGSGEELARVWNDARRTQIAGSFDATKVGYAATAWRQASKHVDQYAAKWAAAHQAACHDVRVRKVQSADMLDRRMACLRGQLRQLDSLLGLFTQADTKVVEHAIGAVGRLPETAACADMDYVLSSQKPPDNPNLAKLVAAISLRADAATAVLRSGKPKQALEGARGILRDALAAGYSPLIADAELLLGKTQRALGDYKAAEKTLSSAYFRARKSNYERVSAEAASMLIWAVGYDQARYKEALQWAGHAQVELKRPRLLPAAAVSMYSSVGVLMEIRGEYAKALVQHKKALAVLDSLDGERPVLRAKVLNQLGTTLDELGRLDEAETTLTRSLRMTEETFGSSHPSVITPLSNLGLVQTGRGQFAAAVATQQRVLAITQEIHHKDHLQTGYAALNLGVAMHRSGMFDAALVQFRRALRIVAKALGPQHPDTALCHNSIGAALQDLRRYDEALVHVRKALAINIAKHGKQHQRVAENRANIGALLSSKKAYPAAIKELESAVAIYDKVALGSPKVAFALVRLGITHNEAGTGQKALAPLERALALQTKSKTDRVELGVTRFELARALWSSRLDRKRAAQLAQTARADMLSTGTLGKKLAAKTKHWLTKHNIPIAPVESP